MASLFLVQQNFLLRVDLIHLKYYGLNKKELRDAIRLKVYDVIILGADPARISTAIQLKRANLPLNTKMVM